ncbi:MAG: HPr family phosphocarrier protein [Anaerolineales bacterium]|nr:HPr family phosphocarrier protein [Anaerolineales bacterium]MCX7608487.1 HPr family phosphocarrier protein [Anaerolineales bacterium]MDW8226923.1 HPr family phosphocarrier protein [Anaerolineales bacterium]
MPELTLTIQHKVGLHARPASLFVREAAKFQSNIMVFHDGKEANAKSILSVLALGVNQGAQITLRAEGPDAEMALQALQALIEKNFGEAE